MPLDLPPIHNFPPFFTRQPNSETFAAQRQQWAALILVYCKENKIHAFSLDTETTTTSGLFTNKAIERTLKVETLKEIIDHMVVEGQAAYSSKKRDAVLIYWRTPEDWAKLLEKYIMDTGQNGSVLTIYELTEDVDAQSSDFHGMDKLMLRKVIDIMAKKNRAIIMKGADGEEQGIKFL